MDDYMGGRGPFGGEDLSLLWALVAVSATGSIRAAAVDLRQTPARVIASIEKLEAARGARLVNIVHRRHVMLTRAGRELLGETCVRLCVRLSGPDHAKAISATAPRPSPSINRTWMQEEAERRARARRLPTDVSFQSK